MTTYNKGGVVVRDAGVSDVAAVVTKMRRKDEEEVLASGFASAHDALAYSFGVSCECYTIEFEKVGTVWFLGAEGMGKIKKTFVKQSRVVIAKFLEKFPILTNYVDARYGETISWLESCGAVFDEPINIGKAGARFQRFEIRRKI